MSDERSGPATPVAAPTEREMIYSTIMALADVYLLLRASVEREPEAELQKRHAASSEALLGLMRKLGAYMGYEISND